MKHLGFKKMWNKECGRSTFLKSTSKNKRTNRTANPVLEGCSCFYPKHTLVISYGHNPAGQEWSTAGTWAQGTVTSTHQSSHQGRATFRSGKQSPRLWEGAGVSTARVRCQAPPGPTTSVTKFSKNTGFLWNQTSSF